MCNGVLLGRDWGDVTPLENCGDVRPLENLEEVPPPLWKIEEKPPLNKNREQFKSILFAVPDPLPILKIFTQFRGGFFLPPTLLRLFAITFERFTARSLYISRRS